MTFRPFSRRRLLQGAGMAALAGAMPVQSAFAKTATVGFIYVGPRDDFGYNQSHAEGAAALKKMKGVKVVEEERIPETVQVAKTMESMINLDGAGLLFPTSFGYFNPYILQEAKKYPKVRFEHAAVCGRRRTRRTPAAISAISSKGQYLNGIVAGYASKSGKLGFVAAKPIPQVLQNINAFTLGARSVEPEDHHPGHLHRRLVAAGQGSRSHQQPGRPGRRRRHHATSTAPRWWCRPRPSAAPWCAAITAARRRSRPRTI